jgi:uncharacterized protein YbgA (DUF1722 family)/uncharacterized protein YbbK (DUF523 family)
VSGLAAPKLRIGVSACLLGQQVRFDGGHKRDRFLLETLGSFVEWVPVCPEVEMGLDVPRPTLRLELDRPDGEVRLAMPKSGRDYTRQMNEYSARRSRELGSERLSGYVFKKDSPSCGLRSVKVYPPKGPSSRTGVGLFAETLVSRFPHLPVEDEGRLHDARLRENFVSHVLAYRQWQELEREGFSVAGLMRFHQLHKLTMMAHSQNGMRRLGRLLGSSDGRRPLRDLAAAYLEGFTALMRRTPTRKSHTNVLQHLAGYVSKELDPQDRRELTETIEQYRLGLLPLIVAVTLLRHHARRQEQPYLSDQVYLYAHPHQLMLLNQI